MRVTGLYRRSREVGRWKRAGSAGGTATRISLPELLELRAKDGVELAKYVSVEHGRALIEVVTADGACTVTVVDPETEVDPQK